MIQQGCWGKRVYQITGLILSGWLVGLGNSISAQITPDNSLGAENSRLNPNGTVKGEAGILIEGGATRGLNLFHSFQNFNVGEGQRVYFANPAGIQNILTRVTGSQASNLQGLLGVNGAANLFLLNPKGIIFSENASLDVSGSFLATTAETFKFAGDTEFSATNPQSPPLLAINVPVGLQFGPNPAPINIAGQGHRLFPGKFGEVFRDDPGGLRVPSRQTLALMGGNISLNGGNLTAGPLAGSDATQTEVGGRIELGSVAQAGFVGITQVSNGLTFDYQNLQNFGNINLSGLSGVDASGAGGGDIRLQGNRVTLTEGSTILAITQGAASGGILSVNATDSLEILGTDIQGIPSSLLADTLSLGSAGDIQINAGKLIVRDGAQVSLSIFGDGIGGNLEVVALDSVELSDEAILTTATVANGRPGNITINTENLTVEDGAFIFTSVSPDNTKSTLQRGGNITIKTPATGSVNLIGDFGLSTSTEGAENGGNINIETGFLRVQDGAQVNTSTFGSGNAGNIMIRATDIELVGTTPDGLYRSGLFAQIEESSTGIEGNITVDTQNLTIQGGAQISAASIGAGQGGTIQVTASESINLSGRSITGDYASGLFASTGGSQDAGSIAVTTPLLLVRNGAEISVDNQVFSVDSDSNEISTIQSTRGIGNAGDIRINANLIQLERQGKITGISFEGQGGNIEISSQDIRLRQGSAISTTSGTEAQGGGDGGNITMTTNTLTALENSDITANAFEGNGGAVNITADGIFGTQYRNRSTPDSDITASSTFGLQGEVLLNTPEIDPTRGLLKTPDAPTPIPQFPGGCQVESAESGSSFIITRTGGVPSQPSTPANSPALWDDLRPLQNNLETPSVQLPTPPPQYPQLVEARGLKWADASKQVIELTAEVDPSTTYTSWQAPIRCDGTTR